MVVTIGVPPHGGAPVGASGDDSCLGKIRVPEGFDAGDSKPGDEIEVTARCRLSEDGKVLEVLSVDGAGGEEGDETKPQEEGEPPAASGDEGPGSRWAKYFGQKG